MIRCPICGKVLSENTNDEDCPNSPFRHGKHPIFVISAIKCSTWNKSDVDKPAT